jgi:hypothetical protein
MDTSGRISAVSEDRMATDLLRLARDPVTGRIKHRTGVDVCLRAALFADLALRGQIINRRGSPAVALPEPTGDRMLDAVRGTVAHRPGVVWLRWFRHVSTDCTALRNELIADGRWQRQGGWRACFADQDSDAMLALAHQLDQVTRHERAPTDSREAVLATLAAMCGATTGGLPRPVTVKQDLEPLFTTFAEDTIPKIIDAAATSMRRARRGGSGLARPAGGVLNWLPRRRAG